MLATLLAAFGMLCLIGCGESSSGDEVLRILHVNDHHANLEASATVLRVPMPPSGVPEDIQVSLGGFARVTEAFRHLAQGRENVLKLHAGDAMTGTLYHTLHGGRADAALMNTICFDAMAVGNHEFDDGDAGLNAFIEALWTDPHCKTPVLSANTVPGSASPLGPDRLRSWVVLVRGGKRVGLIGLTAAAKTQHSSRPDPGTRFTAEATAAQAAIDALNREGVDRIVLLTHIGHEADLHLARSLSGVDVIVGGDSHTLLGPGRLQAFGLLPVNRYPVRVRNKDGDLVCVVQAWQYGALVGALDVRFDRTGRVLSCEGEPTVLIGEDFSRAGGPLDATGRAAVLQALAGESALRVTPEDAGALAVLAPYKAALAPYKAETVATVPADLCLRRVPGSRRDASRSLLPGCNDHPHVLAHGGDVQQLVAHAFLEQGQRFGGADVALQNGGGVRIDLAAGRVTVGTVYTALPFRNTLVRVLMTGAELRATLEEAMAAVVAGSTGAYPYAAGLRWTVDLGQPAGTRLSRLEVRMNGRWQALDEAAHYRVIVIDFLAAGQGGYATLATIPAQRKEDTFLAYAEAFLRHAREHGTLVRPPSEAFSTQRFVDLP